MASTITDKRGAAASTDRRRALLIGLVAVVVVGFIVLISWLSVGESGSRVTLSDIAGDPVIDGEPLLPAAQDPASDPEIGTTVPVVRGADFDGTPVTIGEPGTPQLLMFMAHWCPACDEELRSVSPWLNAGNLPDEVELIAVATSFDPARPNWPPDEWFAGQDYPGPILVDDVSSSVSRAFGLTATPFWVAIDADGEVVARIAGMIPVEQIEALAAMAAS